MPTERLSVRRIRQVLQMHFGARTSARVIAREVGVGRSTVQDYVARANAAKLGWPLPAELSDESLERLLFPASSAAPGVRRHPEPDWAALVREMKRPAVSLMILWEEYSAAHPQGYGYSRFCALYRAFERRLSPTMRQTHAAGQKAFVDYSGKKISITDPRTGEIRMAEIFVGVLGASSLTYAEATWTQTLPDWIGAHVRMFRFFGAVPRLLVPDNLKSGINKASFYDPEVNRTYGAMASHYGVGVLPTRPRKLRDKACVEAGVRFAQYYILGRLRNQKFFSLTECNVAVSAAMAAMNDRVMRRLGLSRRQLFESVERPESPSGKKLYIFNKIKEGRMFFFEKKKQKTFGSSGNRVGVFGGQSGGGVGMHYVFPVLKGLQMRYGRGCQIQAQSGGVCPTYIRSLGSGRASSCVAFSVIPMCGSSPSTDAQKNGLRVLRSGPNGLVRSPNAHGSRPAGRGLSDLFGTRSAANRLPGLRLGEA